MDMNNLSLKSVLKNLGIGGFLKALAGWIFALCFAVAAGCASDPMRGRSDQEVIKERAQARWNAMVKSDFGTAYSYMSPSGRAIITKDGYATTLKEGFWTDAQVKGVTCSGPEACDVHLLIEYAHAGSRFKTPLVEKWVKNDGNWWYLYER
jgi:hypothetical protein